MRRLDRKPQAHRSHRPLGGVGHQQPSLHQGGQLGTGRPFRKPADSGRLPSRELAFEQRLDKQMGGFIAQVHQPHHEASPDPFFQALQREHPSHVAHLIKRCFVPGLLVSDNLKGDPARLRLAGRSARQRTLACPAGGATPLTACPSLLR